MKCLHGRAWVTAGIFAALAVLAANCGGALDSAGCEVSFTTCEFTDKSDNLGEFVWLRAEIISSVGRTLQHLLDSRRLLDLPPCLDQLERLVRRVEEFDWYADQALSRSGIYAVNSWNQHWGSIDLGLSKWLAVAPAVERAAQQVCGDPAAFDAALREVYALMNALPPPKIVHSSLRPRRCGAAVISHGCRVKVEKEYVQPGP